MKEYSQLLLAAITAIYVILTGFLVREVRRQSRVHIRLQDILRLKEAIRLCWERVLLHTSPFAKSRFDVMKGLSERSPGFSLEMLRDSVPVLTPDLREQLGGYIYDLRRYGELVDSLHTSEEFNKPVPGKALVTTQEDLTRKFDEDNDNLIELIRTQTLKLTKSLEEMI